MQTNNEIENRGRETNVFENSQKETMQNAKEGGFQIEENGSRIAGMKSRLDHGFVNTNDIGEHRSPKENHVEREKFISLK